MSLGLNSIPILTAALLTAGHAVAGNQETSIKPQAEPMNETFQDNTDQPSNVANRILVKFSDTVATAQVQTINSRLGVKVINTLQGGSLMVVEVPYAQYRDQIMDAYAATEGVLYAEPDQVVSVPTPQPDVSNEPDEAPLIPLPKIE